MLSQDCGWTGPSRLLAYLFERCSKAFLSPCIRRYHFESMIAPVRLSGFGPPVDVRHGSKPPAVSPHLLPGTTFGEHVPFTKATSTASPTISTVVLVFRSLRFVHPVVRVFCSSFRPERLSVICWRCCAYTMIPLYPQNVEHILLYTRTVFLYCLV